MATKAMMRRTALAATMIVLGFAPVTLADAPFGPKVGTKAPKVAALADQNGKPQTFARLAGPKGVVLMFFRSAKWCPYCQVQLIAMNGGVGEIEKRGYKLVAVSYEPPSVDKAFADRRDIAFTLLSDPGSRTIDRWGLRDPQYPPGNMAYGVPRPIIFILDRKGVIRGSLPKKRSGPGRRWAKS